MDLYSESYVHISRPIYNYIIIIIIINSCEFFTPALIGDLSLGCELRQVSSGLQDSSQYSRWS